MDSMTCREFEDHMRSEFGSVDAVEWKRRITREDWTGLPPSEHIAHLEMCSDCQSSLHLFLDVPDLDYLSHPCFHVAYNAANTTARGWWRHEWDYHGPPHVREHHDRILPMVWHPAANFGRTEVRRDPPRTGLRLKFRAIDVTGNLNCCTCPCRRRAVTWRLSGDVIRHIRTLVAAILTVE